MVVASLVHLLLERLLQLIHPDRYGRRGRLSINIPLHVLGESIHFHVICLNQTSIQYLASTDMGSKMAQVKSDLPPKPPCNIVKGYGGKKDVVFNQNDVALLRDNFTTSTWLLIGATLQTLLFLLPLRPSYALAPAVLLLSYRFTANLLMCFGLKRNPYMDGVTVGKRAALYPPPSPDEKGPASEEICVILLAARCNQYLSPPLPSTTPIPIPIPPRNLTNKTSPLPAHSASSPPAIKT
jgi:hypothetical protein